MCECGCGEGMAPVLRFPGPPGFVYAIGLYAGCIECSNPAGIVLYRVPESAWDYDTFGPAPEEAVEAPFQTFHRWEEFTIPVIDREGLLEAMREELGIPEDYDGDGAIEDGSRAFVAAASKSFDALLEPLRKGSGG